MYLRTNFLVGFLSQTKQGGNYNNVLPLKAARRDSISKLTSFWASNLSCKQTQCCLI